ncbi:MAG TPA: hypothetical protein VK989_12760 [Polyangia bacterium]|nr:hypothetical protein [Polyangia bacterium]
MRRATRVAGLAGLLAVAPWLAGTSAARAASIVIDDADPPGQGLNDPTTVAPRGGNPATTLGAARLTVFREAAVIWGSYLSSAVPIRVHAQMTALTCDSTSAELADTGTTTVHRDFPMAPLASTWYPQALANALSGADLDPTTDDVETEFNDAIGGASCLPGSSWYLGLDGQPGNGQIDMLTVVLHELAHGLGFATFDDLATGQKLLGLDDAFLRDMQQLGANPAAASAMTDAERIAASGSDPDLYWSGANVTAGGSALSAGLISGHVRLFAPATQQPGSSVSHYSTALFPNELMEPNYTGPDHDVTLTLDLLRDIGWQPNPAPAVPALPVIGRGAAAFAFLVIAMSKTRRRRRVATPSDGAA